MHAIDKHEEKLHSCEKNKTKVQENDLAIFLFLFHFVRWFLVVPPKDTFTQHHPKLLQVQSIIGLQVDHTTTPSNYILDCNNLQVWLFNFYGLVGILCMYL